MITRQELEATAEVPSRERIGLWGSNNPLCRNHTAVIVSLLFFFAKGTFRLHPAFTGKCKSIRNVDVLSFCATFIDWLYLNNMR